MSWRLSDTGERVLNTGGPPTLQLGEGLEGAGGRR